MKKIKKKEKSKQKKKKNLKNRENFYWNRRKRNRNIKGNKKLLFISKKYWEEKVDLKKENLKEFILKLNQKDINELMANSEKEEDIIFYNKLFNLILETKQDELIKKGVF